MRNTPKPVTTYDVPLSTALLWALCSFVSGASVVLWMVVYNR